MPPSATDHRKHPRGYLPTWDGISHALQDALESFINQQPRKWPLYLWGEPGVGKSYAMAWLYCSAIGGIGQNPKWVDAVPFIQEIQAARQGRHDFSEWYLWDRFETASVAFVDDIGVRAPTESQFEIVYGLTDRRITKPTVFAGNLSPLELAKTFDKRIAGRICQGRVIHVTGDDRRIKLGTVIEA